MLSVKQTYVSDFKCEGVLDVTVLIEKNTLV